MVKMSFSLQPQGVPKIESTFRRIVTELPVPESVPILKRLRENEPASMFCQPPIVWDRAEGFQVYDRYGNIWLDWSSGVLVANSGHAHPKVRKAIISMVEHGLLHNYVFPNAIRAELTSKLLELAPAPLDKVYLLTTGSEATECAIKLARTFGQTINVQKIGIVSFENAFHGRTFGAQMAGGIPSLKAWIREPAPGFYQAPFPDGFRTRSYRFNDFLSALSKQGVAPEQIAGVMTETYQGGDASFAPKEFIQELRQWCTDHQILLIFDEVQAGFGRTGKLFAFEHYDVVPDLICCGKGISSSLPLSAVLGQAKVMDLQQPGEMTSTHAGNPVCCAAALANLQVLEDEDLIANSRRVGEILHSELAEIKDRYEVVGAVQGRGLVAGLLIVKKGTTEPDGVTAFQIVNNAVKRGLMLFAPVGLGGGTVKISPPLTITVEAVREGAAVLSEAIEEAVKAKTIAAT